MLHKDQEVELLVSEDPKGLNRAVWHKCKVTKVNAATKAVQVSIGPQVWIPAYEQASCIRLVNAKWTATTEPLLSTAGDLRESLLENDDLLERPTSSISLGGTSSGTNSVSTVYPDDHIIKHCQKSHDSGESNLTLELLLHLLEDRAEDAWLNNKDKKHWDYIKSTLELAIDKCYEKQGERCKAAKAILRQVTDELSNVMETRQGSGKEEAGMNASSWSDQHEVLHKIQKARFLLSHTDEMRGHWSLKEFHEEEFFETNLDFVKEWCWFTFPFRQYYNSLRLRVPYFCFLTSVLAISTFTGLLVETFMSTFSPLNSSNSSLFFLYLWFLPLLTVFFAFGIEGVVKISFDAMKAAPLINVQASILQGLDFMSWPRFLVLLVWAAAAGSAVQTLVLRHWAKLLIFFITLVIAAMLIRIFKPEHIPLLDDQLYEVFKKNLYCTITKFFFVFLYCLILVVMMFFDNGLMAFAFVTFLCSIAIMALFPKVKPEEISGEESGSSALWNQKMGKEKPEDARPPPKKAEAPALWKRQATDVIMFALIEVWPVGSGLYGLICKSHEPDGRGRLGGFLRSYLWGAVCGITGLTALVQCLNAYIVGKSGKFRDFIKGCEKCYDKCCKRKEADQTKTVVATRFFQKDSEEARMQHDLLKRGADKAGESRQRMVRMFHRDHIGPGMLSQVPKGVFEHVEYDREDVMCGLTAYLLSKERLGVPIWKYFYYTIPAVIFGVLIRSARLTNEDRGATWNKWELVGIGLLTVPIILTRALIDTITKYEHLAWLKTPAPPIVPFLIMLMVWTVSVIVATSRENPAWLIPLLCPSFLLVNMFAALSAENALTGLLERIYWFASWFFWFAFAALMISPAFELQPFDAQISIVGVDASLRHKLKDEPRHPDHQYNLCKFRYGSYNDDAKGSKLTALDLAQLSGLTYEQHRKTIRHKLADVFPDQTEIDGKSRTANMLHCTDYWQTPRFCVFDIGSENITRVIAIKGTSTNEDVYLDAALFSSIKVLQWFELLLPIITLFPLDQIQWFLYRAHLFGTRASEEEFWMAAAQNISAYTGRCESCENVSSVILTGHSLGGFLAQIIAARLNLPAMVYSSPGVKYSAERFGIYNNTFWKDYAKGEGTGRPHAEDYGVQILKFRARVAVPDFDQVAKVDAHLAEVDHINCRKKDAHRDRAYSENGYIPFSSGHCHSLVRTQCEIWRVCGDPYKRKFDCGHYVAQDDINRWERPDDND